MLSVPHPRRSEENDLTRCEVASHEQFNGSLAQARGQVLAAYSSYADVAFKAGDQVELEEAPADALRWSYELTYSGRKMRDVREDLLSNLPRNLCPLCGVGRPTTLDHYLPKTHFPEYAVKASNLVPCCKDCNFVKRDEHTQSADRCFHPYYDDLPVGVFLHAEIEVAESSISVQFEVLPCDGMPEETFMTLRHHFNKLDLNSIYVDSALNEMSARADAMAMYADEGRAALDVFLARQLNSAVQDLGVNHWRSALYRGLNGNEEFCAGGFEFLIAKPG